jgi:hypothetical protein
MKNKNILEEANSIINERSQEKERQYGPMNESMERTAQMASLMRNKQISAEDCFAVMIALKLARNAYSYKRDNNLDGVAYWGAWDNYVQESIESTQPEKERAVVSINFSSKPEF